MKVVPAEVLDVKSAAERRIHAYLREIAFGPADVALHSLNLGQHEYKRWGEADFVLITRRGLLLIEVKGGRVSSTDGIWAFTNRFGQVTKKRESPAAQAKSAFFSLLENYLRPRFGHELNGLTMGWGVVFDGLERLVSSGDSTLPEQPDELTGYRRDCLGHNSFSRYLKQVYGHWRAKVHGDAKEMSNKLISEIATFLRPNFEKVPPLNSRLYQFNEELCEFSDEQCARFDEIQENDRIMIAGGAGTGKTFLAVACARYDAARKRNVLFFTKSPFLASFLQSHKLPTNITVGSSADLDRFSSSGMRRWDTLIVDEGQDLCQLETVVALGDLLSGGLEGGRWRWFGDQNNQVATDATFDPETHEYLAGIAFRARLHQNVRNAPPIVNRIHEIAKADVGEPRSRGLGSKVRYKVARDQQAIPQTVLDQITDWTSAKSVPRTDIAVLVPDNDLRDMVVDKLNDGDIRAEVLSAKALSTKRRDCVIVSRVEDFKGLEKPVVCIGGLPPDSSHELLRRTAYGGFSRANHTLTVIATERELRHLDGLKSPAKERQNDVR